MRVFPTEQEHILALLDTIDPSKYRRTRNFLNGSVTYLSPYISRGVLTTKYVFEYLKSRSYSWYEVEKLVQELAWRDFFQQVWIRLGDTLNQDIKHKQEKVRSEEIPSAILSAQTGIQAIDMGIQTLYQSGYMHNHQRMYTASVSCNLAQCHWKTPARWMYYHLLDADWASNACSWQWVAGSFSNKKYYANQENINRYCFTRQEGTFLDTSYEDLALAEIPGILLETQSFSMNTRLPETDAKFNIDNSIPTLIFNWYNIDFEWYKTKKVNRVLLLEPDVFARYPISEKSVRFMLELSQNIPGIQVFVGSFSELKQIADGSPFLFKEHPLNRYEGTEEQRTPMVDVPDKTFHSFFSYWKHIEPQLKQHFSLEKQA